MKNDFHTEGLVPNNRVNHSESRESPNKTKRNSHLTELKQLHNLEVLVRNEESLGFIEYYIQNQR